VHAWYHLNIQNGAYVLVLASTVKHYSTLGQRELQHSIVQRQFDQLADCLQFVACEAEFKVRRGQCLFHFQYRLQRCG
jgi:hypothetical protein